MAVLPTVERLAGGAGIGDVLSADEPAVRDVLLEVLYASGSGLLLLPVQDVFGWRDRINEPATVNDDELDVPAAVAVRSAGRGPRSARAAGSACAPGPENTDVDVNARRHEDHGGLRVRCQSLASLSLLLRRCAAGAAAWAAACAAASRRGSRCS